MDVRCPACEVEYEFDDDKVTPAGVTVKCTSCSHVFKVKKDGAAPVFDMPAAPTADWMIRQQDGRSFKFKELTTLQKWIVEQKVSRDDQISRTGQHWKPLGEIAELASFFQVVDAARAAQQMAAQSAYGSVPPGSMQPGSVPPQMAMGPGGMPPGSVPPGSAPPGYGSAPPGYAMPPYPGTPPPGAMPPGSAPPQMAMPAGSPSPVHGAPNPIAGQAQGTYPPGHRPTLETMFDPAMPMADLGNSRLDDDDPVAQWRRRGRRKRVALLLLVALVGGAGGLYWARPDLVQPWLAKAGLKIGEPAGPAPALVDAEAALAGDDAALQAAQARFAPLVAEGAPEALALAARLHTARARLARWSWLASQATAASDGKDDKPAKEDKPSGDAATVGGQSNKASLQNADALLSLAYDLAGKAMAKGAKSAHLANADYQAAKGALAEMEADLKAAPLPAGAEAEAAVVRVLGRAHRAIVERSSTSMEQLTAALSATELPREDRRVLTATVLAKAATGAHGKALLADLDALQVIEGVGGVATTLRPLLANGAVTLPALATGRAAGKVTGQAGAPPAEAPADQPGDKPQKRNDDDDKGKDDDDGDKPQVSYSTLVARGKKALMGGRSSSALSYFRKAEAAKPGDPAASSGMGWAYLDLGKDSASVRAFNKALDKDPGWADAHLGLGEAYRAQGDKAAAIKHFKRYLDLKPNGAEASVAKRALKQLE